ncbi:MAG TPA: hypothetical protein VEA41_11765 [Salinarimonas sp.]|nr:hypothetical protein [Salinarimonas sp.]
MSVGRWFVAGIWAFGLASALAVATVPALRSLGVPSLAWPLLAALVTDLALRPAVAAGRIAPVTMNERFVAVIGAALIHTLVLAAVAPAG